MIDFLSTKDHYRLEEVREYVEEHYDVIYKSKQSYDDLLHEAHIGWKKTEKSHPAHDEDQGRTRREAIKTLLNDRQEDIASGELVVVAEDECHLLWGDTLGYVWGRRNQAISVPIKNIKERQTSYGAVNLVTKDVHICPFQHGNSHYTVKFVKHVQALYPQAKLLFLWDGAAYHRYAEMQTYLQDVNQGLDKHEWQITCELFAPNAPEQNPVEDIWLKGKNVLRKYFYTCTTFAQIKQAFLQFLRTTTFHFPKLDLYTWEA